MAKNWEDLTWADADTIAWGEYGIQLLTHDPETGDPLVVIREKKEYPGALLLRVTNIDLARATLGDEPILAALDGSSFRVAQQDVNRVYLVDCATRKSPPSRRVLQQRLYMRLAGIRRKAEVGARVPKTVEVIVVRVGLPSGTIFVPTAGDDTPVVDQLRSAWIADMTEMGIPTAKVLEKAATIDFAGMLKA